jgi:hypothetical protein
MSAVTRNQNANLARICPFHKVHHKKPCAQIVAQRANRGAQAPARQPAAQASNNRGRGANAPRQRRSPTAAPARATRPTVDDVFRRKVLGSNAMVARYHFRYTERTEALAYEDARLEQLKLEWIPETPRDQAGRLYAVVLGSNETAPTDLDGLLSRDGVEIFEPNVSRTVVMKTGLYEKSFNAQRQAAHQKGGAFIFCWSTMTHATATTELGRLNIHAKVSYAAHQAI